MRPRQAIWQAACLPAKQPWLAHNAAAHAVLRAALMSLASVLPQPASHTSSCRAVAVEGAPLRAAGLHCQRTPGCLSEGVNDHWNQVLRVHDWHLWAIMLMLPACTYRRAFSNDTTNCLWLCAALTTGCPLISLSTSSICEYIGRRPCCSLPPENGEVYRSVPAQNRSHLRGFEQEGKCAHPWIGSCLALLGGLCSLASLDELLASDSAPSSGATSLPSDVALSLSPPSATALSLSSAPLLLTRLSHCWESFISDSAEPEEAAAVLLGESCGTASFGSCTAAATARRPCSAKAGKRAEMGPFLAAGELWPPAPVMEHGQAKASHLYVPCLGTHALMLYEPSWTIRCMPKLPPNGILTSW